MPINVQKKDNEPFESMLKRFNRQVIRSGLMTIARQRFFEKKPSKNLARKDAVRKTQMREERKKAAFKRIRSGL